MANNIAITSAAEKKGRMRGESEGLLQVLRERGLIDGLNIKQYSLTGKKDAFGSAYDYGICLRHLMVFLCYDFINEEGMLQHIAKCLCVKLFWTSVILPELAGENIWGGAKKGECRRLSLAQKRGKDITRPVCIIAC